MVIKHPDTFNAYSLGIQRTQRLNDLIHFFLSALTAPSGGNFAAAILFLYNKRSHVLQGMLGITQETASFVLPPEAPLQVWCYPRVTTESQRLQRDDDFNRAAIRLRFQLAGTTSISRACKEGVSCTLPGTEEDDEITGLFNHFFAISKYACIPLSGREGLIGAVILTGSTASLPA